ncbi:peptidyl-prolyl cis-trans isomerase CYP40-like [Durio zibethinus]|uniref:Peptidyl-prolyl cis-trans isomerase CYP40-like n=1 Tax=Durio zibethinus TaxID=66656 RepID=A0A6P6BAD1_DURZI|nr:peptidyl-prolyl cis-trans isomerase CYP40-like [Durio zibethinus]
MANAGLNTNGSLLFITTTLTFHLDGELIVFGKVVKGMRIVRPIKHVMILEGADDGISKFFNDGDICGDIYCDWLADIDESTNELSWWMTVVASIKAFRNEHYKKQYYKMVFTKYKKALLYLDVCQKKDREEFKFEKGNPRYSQVAL